MMPWWVLLIFVLGANFALWGTVGLVRLAESLAGQAASEVGQHAVGQHAVG